MNRGKHKKEKKQTARIYTVVLVLLVFFCMVFTSACEANMPGSGVAGLPTIPPPPQAQDQTPEPLPRSVPDEASPVAAPQPTPEPLPAPLPVPSPEIEPLYDTDVYINVASRIDPSLPMIALTFDDGPGGLTDKVLDLLELHGVVATFYVIGNQVERNRETVLRAFNLGCEIANHTWSHSSLDQISADGIRSQLMNTNTAIESITGSPPLHMRPPFGRINSEVKNVTRELGLPIILWSIDPSDYLQGRTSEAIYELIMEDVKDKDIILLHDIHERTIRATEWLIPSLIERGFQFVTVSELMHFSDITLDPGDSYRHAR